MRPKCYKTERLLSDYIDGTLTERQTADVEAHLRNCHACQQKRSELKKMNHLLSNFYVQPEASDFYFARFTTRLQQRIEQNAPTAPHQRLLGAVTLFGWYLRTQCQRALDHTRLSGVLSIKRHAFPYYMLGLTIALLVVAPLLLNQISPPEGADAQTAVQRLATAAKTRLFGTAQTTAIQPTAALTITQEQTSPNSIRKNVSSERTTASPTPDSGSDVWQFTDEPMTEGYIFTTLQKQESDTEPNVPLDIDSELLAYAELPTNGAFWARLTDRDVLTESRYALLLLQGIDAGQHARQQYERKWSQLKGFSQKLLDVPAGILAPPDPYSAAEL